MKYKIALFSKGYIAAYSNAEAYHIHIESRAWRFGFWLGRL